MSLDRVLSLEGVPRKPLILLCRKPRNETVSDGALLEQAQWRLMGYMLSVPVKVVQWSIEAMCVNAATRRKRLHEISRFDKKGEWCRAG